MQRSDEEIVIEATIGDDGFPAVAVMFEGHTEIMSVDHARKFAFAVLDAAAIAENEVAIFDGIHDLDRTQKGFTKRMDRDSAAVKTVALLRQFRPEMPYGIHSFRGMVSCDGVVTFPWPTREKGLQFDLPGARIHANQLIEAAEAAETDGFLRHFMMWKIGSSEMEAQAMVMEFREFRSRVQLENALKKSEGEQCKS